MRVDSANTVVIDASKLDSPTQSYDADLGWVEYRPGKVSVLFAKRSLDDEKALDSRLEVRYSLEDFVRNFLSGISPHFWGRLTDYVNAWPAAARQTEGPVSRLKAARTHSEWARLSYISHSGSEAAIDFYHMSPSALARFNDVKSLDGLKVRGVVHVQMTTFELFALLQRARPIAEEIKGYLPERHRALLEGAE